MICSVLCEPDGSLCDQEREHILGRSPLNFDLVKGYGRTRGVEQRTGSEPRLEGAEDVEFNTSHIKGLMVCAVADRVLGTGAEQIRPFRAGLMGRMCFGTERSLVMAGRSEMERQERFFRLWILKESYVKTIGIGLAFPLGDITFSLEEGAIEENIPGWWFYQSRVYQSCITSIYATGEKGESV